MSPSTDAERELLPSATPTFLQSDRAAARVMQPVVKFLHVEAAGGILLLVATVVALVWANSPWDASYGTLWSTAIRIDVGTYTFEEDLGHVVNDLLMAVFFFVVGMEIKRELVTGELRDRRAVALPAMAALGGMVVPAAIYLAFNVSGGGTDGWGIPMATDIAFALGVVAVLGSRVPSTVKVLLLTLAIVDDIGAILVIAIFYTDKVQFSFLLTAAVVTIVIAVMHRFDVTFAPLLVLAGFVLWLTVYESGVHATIAGVLMGLLMPARPMHSELEADEVMHVLNRDDDITAADVRRTASVIGGTVSPCDRLIDLLHPWTSYLIVPIFALANAGIAISSDSLSSPSSVLVGVAVALVVGKFVGVTLFSWVAVKLGFAHLPAGVRWGHIYGVAAVAGIGFTVSLFIAGLAFDDELLQDDAKLGTLIASVLAAIAGAVVLSVASRRTRDSATEPQ
jgi:NhaA family Na+:H+ antiporter